MAQTYVMTEDDIIGAVYAMYEGEGEDNKWSATDDEYLAARSYANAGVRRWEFYEMTQWKELFSTLDASATGDKTLSSGDYSYTCPTDFVRPVSYVYTKDSSGNKTFYRTLQPQDVAHLSDTGTNWVYFTGNPKDGYTLNFNPKLTLTTGHTIHYSYYKGASTFTTTSSTSEMSDPYFLVYFILSRFYENDGEDAKAAKAFQEAEARLEQMRTQNMLADWNQQSGILDIHTDIYGISGFGEPGSNDNT